MNDSQKLPVVKSIQSELNNSNIILKIDDIKLDRKAINSVKDQLSKNDFHIDLTISGTSGLSALKSTLMEIENELNAVTDAIKSIRDVHVSAGFDDLTQPVSDEKTLSLLNSIQTVLNQNTLITERARAELQKYTTELSGGGVTLGKWNRIQSLLVTTETQMKHLGELGDSLRDQMTLAAESFDQSVSLPSFLIELANQFKSMPDEVRKLDRSLLDLSKVSDLTATQISRITENAFVLGDKVGKTGSQVIDAITALKRSSFDMEDTFAQAENALKMTNIADSIDDAALAAEYLIKIMRGYQDTSVGFSDKILNAVNEVSRTQAVDFDNLIDGAQSLAAVAEQAQVSFEEMLGVLTGGYEVIGDMEQVSNGLISVFSHLQSLQLDGSEAIKPTSEMQKIFSNATKGMVNIVDQSTGQLRGAYDIMEDLAGIWDTLNSKTQSALAENAAGMNQKSIFLNIIENWESVKTSVESATNSFGSADTANEKYLNSIAGKLSKLNNAFEQFSASVANSGLLKFITDLGTALLSVGSNMNTGSFAAIALFIKGITKTIGKSNDLAPCGSNSTLHKLSNCGEILIIPYHNAA